MARGEELGARSAVLKFYGTELNKRRQDLLMSLDGLPALAWQPGADGADGLSRRWLRSKGNSIEGGTSEIMLEIIAKQLLELPRQ
jgi:acyl-CoA dehydrogenase